MSVKDLFEWYCTSREGSFTGQHEGYIKEGSGAGHLSP